MRRPAFHRWELPEKNDKIGKASRQQKSLKSLNLRLEDGAFAEIRTPDQLIKSQLLYQLSYEGFVLVTALKIIPF